MSTRDDHQSNSRRKITLAALMLFAMGCGILQGLNPTNTPPPASPAPLTSDQSTEGIRMANGIPQPEGDGFSIRLSSGHEQPASAAAPPLGAGEPLTAQEIDAILARMAAQPLPVSEPEPFKFPPESLPPPRPGQTIQQPFPPPPDAASPADVPAGPLEVLRYSPEGEIPMAPFLNITFNQPMVALGSLAQLSTAEVPVKLEPALQGTWRWLGTRTLSFQVDSNLVDRLPMATVFTATVPAGTRSASGAVLAEAVQWTFSTPAARLISNYPSSSPQPLEPLIFAGFNQRIDPAAVLDTIQLTVNGEPAPIRLASDEEVAADEQVSQAAEGHPQGRWLVFRALNPLPKDADIRVIIGPGTPSAEGPLLSEQPQEFSFSTYPPLRVEDHGCSWYGSDCPPLSPFFIRFNNPLDPEGIPDALITLDPPLAGMLTSVSGNTLTIQGASTARTAYRVRLDAKLTDAFGQQLGHEEQLKFQVGKAEPVLIGPQRTLVTLDPASAKPELSLYTLNYDRLDLKVYAVTPSEWPDFKTYLQDYGRSDRPAQPPGKLVLDDTLRLKTASDSLSEVKVDISQLMDSPFGHFIVIVKPPKGFFAVERYWETVQVWVQVTRIGLDAFADHSQMTAWASALDNGAPLDDVAIGTLDGRTLATTGRDGTARFKLPSDGIPGLIAAKGGDVALLTRGDAYWSDDSWQPQPVADELRWYVMDDRALYRPGEEMHVKGWLRQIGSRQDGDVGLVGESLTRVNYQVIDPQGNELETGTADVTSLGGFDLAFTIPLNTNLGQARLVLTAAGALNQLNGTTHEHTFQVQEFRRPEFEVSARNETQGPYFVGGDAIVALKAAYYAGGPLPNADVVWTVTPSPTNYQPPNWPDFTFGIWIPWWFSIRTYGSPDYQGADGTIGASAQTFEGKTDAGGSHYLRMEFEGDGESRPQNITAEGVVMDVNRQAWASRTSLLVHPASLYVGLRSENYFVARGKPLDIQVIVTDLEGNPVSGQPVDVTAERMVWKAEKGEWEEVPMEPQVCALVSQDGPLTCSFETPLGGKYRVSALVRDDKGRTNLTRITRWVSGGEQPPSRQVEMEEATLVPDKETYQPGDTAQVLVQSPFSPAEGLLTVARSGILTTRRFTLEEGSATLEIPIEEAHIPNLNIQVDLVGSATRSDDSGEPIPGVPERPAFASGSLSLSIPPLGRTLAITANPRQTELVPGESTTIDLTVKTAKGDALEGAELLVAVVDEAVLALTNYQLLDPIGLFYYTRGSGLLSTYGRASIVLVDPSVLQNAAAPQAMATRAPGQTILEQAGDAALGEMMAMPSAPMEASKEMDGEGRGGGGDQPPAIDVRSDFNPLAIFSPEVRTGPDGKASLRVSLPDNLTRYRVMVVAVDGSGSQFGTSEANLTARLPLMVRPSVSRFLNFGDVFELPVVLQNQTNEPMTAEVVVEASNLLLTGDAGLRVEIPARDRVEVRFPATTDSSGTAHVRFAAVSGRAADAAQVSLPVYTPATSEAFATYGVLDEGAMLQPVSAPQDVFPQFGGLEISTSSTALQALSDAVLYLVSYPFDCSEQIASRVLGVAALRDVLAAFEADGLPSPEEMQAAVSADIDSLQGLQNSDGGFPGWRRGNPSIPYHSVHAAHALQRARKMGFEVPEAMWQASLTYLRSIEQYYPEWYSLKTRQTISAYALYTRARMGDGDIPKALALLEDAGGPQGLPLDALAWVWQVLVDAPDTDDVRAEILRHVNNQAVETAAAANFISGYSDDEYVLLHSNRRTDALLLDALIADEPDNDLIPRLVTGLLAQRTRGRWGNTQENVFVLLALERYFKTYESQSPDFVARIWLGGAYAGSSTFEGYNTDRFQVDIPMADLVSAAADGQTRDLVIDKEGDGRLYYRLGLKYAPTDLRLDPLEMGFVVQRVYEGVDDPDDVTLDVDGSWRIKAGARVRVRITMQADSRRYHVALVDPLPAGLEIINPALAVAETPPADPDLKEPGYWWWWRWYEHQNLRDERAEAFTSLLWDGVYEFTYVARATMPGTFVAPPAKAEEMYAPEVFGRSQTAIVIVE